MYTEESVSIGKADSGGFIIHVRVKKKKSKESKAEVICGDTMSKTLVAKDVEEVNGIISKLLPKMSASGFDEDAYAEAFKEAVEG